MSFFQNKWVVLLMATILVGAFFYTKHIVVKNAEMVKKAPDCTMGVVTKVNRKSVLIDFVFSGKIYKAVGDPFQSKTLSYLDINIGDSLLVVFNKNNPKYYLVDFDNRYGLCPEKPQTNSLKKDKKEYIIEKRDDNGNLYLDTIIVGN